MKQFLSVFNIPRQSVAFTMLAFILTSGLILTVISTFITYYFTYQDELRNVDQVLSRLENGHLNDVEEAIDHPENPGILSSELNSIVQEPFIEYAEVNPLNHPSSFVGAKPSNPLKTQTYPLYEDEIPGQKIYAGQLTVITSEADILSQVWQTIFRNFLFMFVLILATGLIFFFGFEYFINRHLRDLAAFTGQNSPNHYTKPFTLNRKKPDREDELGILVRAFNLMTHDLYNALENLKVTNHNLALEIDERKQAEYALEREQTLLAKRVEERTSELSLANADLARAARMKDEFMSSMSHELRTPLAGILGLSEALISNVYGDLNERQLKAVSQINQSGDILLKTINDILDLSKIQSHQIELDITPVNLEDVCQSGQRLIKQQAFKKHISISTQYDPQVNFIKSDERRLKQILVNLLSNAIKFTPENGKVGIELLANPNNHLVAISVWDTGIGISEEDQKKLFQPFKQLDSSLARRYSGTGLGLALVINLVRMLGGGLHILSVLNQGSRFTVSLPWDEEIEGNNLPTGENNPMDIVPSVELFKTLKSRIMVVDDNELTLTTLKDYFSILGATVILCRSSAEAMLSIYDTPPDILLMDIQLPGMDGLETIRRLRRDPKMDSLHIIALTALALEGDRQRCIEAGANDYYAKPFSLKNLAGTIYAYLLKKQKSQFDILSD